MGSAEAVGDSDSLLPPDAVVHTERFGYTALPVAAPDFVEDDGRVGSQDDSQPPLPWPQQLSLLMRPAVLAIAVVSFLLGCAVALLAPPAAQAITGVPSAPQPAPLAEPVRLQLETIAPGSSNYSLSVCIPGWRGRWGNHVYQMMMGVKFAFQHRMRLHLPAATEAVPRVRLFNLPCPNDNEQFVMGGDPGWQETHGAGKPVWYDLDPAARIHNVSDYHYYLDGFFQYPSHLYAPHRQAIRELLTAEPDLLQFLQTMRSRVLASACAHSLVVAMHVRQGDFPNPATADYSVSQPIAIPPSWYLRWLQNFSSNASELQRAKRWQDRDCPVPLQAAAAPIPVALFLASDNATLAGYFRQHGYQVTTMVELLEDAFHTRWVTLRALDYADWWMLGRFRVLAVSHSTFSITASMQSPYADSGEALFFVPDVQTLALAPFDPWNYHYDYAAFSRHGKRIVFGR